MSEPLLSKTQGGDPWKARIDRVFARALFLPLFLALALLSWLLLDTLYRSFSVQVVRSDVGLSQTFPLGTAWQEALKAALLQEGYTEEEAEAMLKDPKELRALLNQNRVELMWNTHEGPLRYVVTGFYDERVLDLPLLQGLRRWEELKAGLGEGERLVLNSWLDQTFLTRFPSRNPLIAGMGVAVAGTVWVLTLALLIAIPVGVGTAILLEEYLREGRLNRILEVNLRNLAGVPSIVYGLLGLAFFVREMGLGPTILAAAFTLALLGIPVITVTAREALRAVPESQRAGGLRPGGYPQAGGLPGGPPRRPPRRGDRGYPLRSPPHRRGRPPSPGGRRRLRALLPLGSPLRVHGDPGADLPLGQPAPARVRPGGRRGHPGHAPGALGALPGRLVR
jgi:phosphate transport system permease protein